MHVVTFVTTRGPVAVRITARTLAHVRAVAAVAAERIGATSYSIRTQGV